ncbi:hypothetical protein [Bordetella trematum]|uniref:hypothetical protein n=1 Tax=Bordetella trematum TaxID=123899 RepID=UPI0012FFFC56|nr:hypothetical protein [Bordetella trematum]
MSDEIEERWLMAVTNAQLHGYVKDLANLLRSETSVPPFAGGFLASLLEGQIELPDQRGKTNSNMSPMEADKLDGWLFEMNTCAAQALSLIDIIADDLALEPFQVRSKINQRKRETISKLAEHFGLSESSVRQRRSARDDGAWAEVMTGDRQLQGPSGERFDFHHSQESRDRSREAALALAKAWLAQPSLFPDLSE